jgi:hypothetical protein
MALPPESAFSIADGPEKGRMWRLRTKRMIINRDYSSQLSRGPKWASTHHIKVWACEKGSPVRLGEPQAVAGKRLR